MSLQKRYMKFKRVTCQHSLRWHFKHRGIYHYVVQISCSWYFIEPCIWNLSTEYKNNKRKQTNGIQHLCESHALYRMILFFHHITTQAHTDTNTDTCLETGKLCGTFSPSRCATDVIFSCTIRWWVSPATGWARVSFLVFDVKTILHLSILAHSALGMRMLHQRSAAACFLIWAILLFISVYLMRRFWIRHIFPVFAVSIRRLHPSQISSRMVHTSLDCMRAELHCCDGKHLGGFDRKIWQFNRDSQSDRFACFERFFSTPLSI